MAPKFSKNAILEGPADFFCVLCEEYLSTAAGVDEHLTISEHLRLIKTVTNVFELNDCIIKVNQGYFCQLCNKLIPLLAKARIHISEFRHLKNKMPCVIQRVGKHVIAFDEMIIRDESWNGLTDDACIICDMEYDVACLHKELPSHIVKLIETKVEFDADKNIFRKIDDTSFQCLTCNVVQNLSSMTVHFNSQEHREFYKVSQTLYINEKASESHSEFVENEDVNETASGLTVEQNSDSTFETEPVAGPSNVNHAQTKKSKSPIEPRVFDLEYDPDIEEKVFRRLNVKDYIIMNDNSIECCIMCDWKVVEDEIQLHLRSPHHQKIYKIHKERLNMMKAKFSKARLVKDNIIENIKYKMPLFEANSIKIDIDDEKVYCEKCNVGILFDHTNILEHINERHKKSVKKDVHEIPIPLPYRSINAVDEPDISVESSEDCVYTLEDGRTFKKVPAKSVTTSLISIDSLFYRDLVINDELCINYFSNSYVARYLDRLKCYACDDEVAIETFEAHIRTDKHEEMCDKAFFIQIDTEFIRQLRTDSFHCGFCNRFETCWKDIEKHLETPFHKECKTNAQWRLQLYQPAIENGPHEVIQTDINFLGIFATKLS